jgi:hypothetical protein
MADARCLAEELRRAADLLDQVQATNEAIQDWCRDHGPEITAELRSYLEDLAITLIEGER